MQFPECVALRHGEKGDEYYHHEQPDAHERQQSLSRQGARRMTHQQRREGNQYNAEEHADCADLPRREFDIRRAIKPRQDERLAQREEQQRQAQRQQQTRQTFRLTERKANERKKRQRQHNQPALHVHQQRQQDGAQPARQMQPMMFLPQDEAAQQPRHQQTDPSADKVDIADSALKFVVCADAPAHRKERQGIEPRVLQQHEDEIACYSSAANRQQRGNIRVHAAQT